MVTNPTIDDLKKVSDKISLIESNLENDLKIESDNLSKKVLIDNTNYQVERLINDLNVLKYFYFKNLGINY